MAVPHHHGTPLNMTREEAAGYKDMLRALNEAAEMHPAEPGPLRCCLCKNEKCAKAAGKKAGGSKTALFRRKEENKMLCIWCYVTFMKTQRLAQRASELYPELA